MISKGPGVQYRRGHSFGRIHKSADVGSWMRSRNHMLDLSLTGFDPSATLAVQGFRIGTRFALRNFMF
jgi:hypothetical protein